MKIDRKRKAVEFKVRQELGGMRVDLEKSIYARWMERHLASLDVAASWFKQVKWLKEMGFFE